MPVGHGSLVRVPLLADLGVFPGSELGAGQPVAQRDPKVAADVAVEAGADKVGLAVAAAVPLEAVLLAATAVVLEALVGWMFSGVVIFHGCTVQSGASSRKNYLQNLATDRMPRSVNPAFKGNGYKLILDVRSSFPGTKWTFH